MLADRGDQQHSSARRKAVITSGRLWIELDLEPDRWFSAVLRASETGILPPDELADARQDMTPEQYEQEFECSFDAAILGAYFGKEIAEAEREGRINGQAHP